MKIEKHSIKSCCGNSSVLFKLDKPISKDILLCLINYGFKEKTNFTKNGVLFVENEYLILNGVFGSDKLNIKCRQKDCIDLINNIEEELRKME